MFDGLTLLDDSPATAEALNRACHCFSLDPGALAHALDSEMGQPGLAALVQERCPHLFAAQPVFVASEQVRRMAAVVRAIESVIALPAWRERVLAQAPQSARLAGVGARGVFFGYDFHLDRDRLSLIEINTNAGGAMLNGALTRAQRACCEQMAPVVPTADSVDAYAEAIIAMFREEWRLSAHPGDLRTLAIVDERPEAQYLYAEFLLFQQLFERAGLRAVIADPAELSWRDGRLMHGDTPIDLVYNRLTDFSLDQPASAALRAAWLAQAVVVTPHPQAHALYADKRHLAVLGSDAALAELGVPAATRALLSAHIPATELVTPAAADDLWARRRQLFFKPAGGFGSRAAYRGDKLTRRVWDEILAGDYVAQAFAAPGERQLSGDPDAPQTLKFDLRAYTYAGRLQWLAARLYQGQTTNFRTPGGGFAPVYTMRDLATLAA